FMVAQVLFYELKFLNHGFERLLDILEVGKANVTPNGVRAFRQPRHIPEAGGRKFHRERRFEAFFCNQAGQGGGKKLRKVAEEGKGPVMTGGIHDMRARANSCDQGDESL